MPEYLHPGVYIEEIERGPRPIEGVPTSTAAFLGETERGPITPRLVTSYKDYQRWFGGVFGDDKFLPYAVNGFFENGGKRAVRLPHRRRGRDAGAGRRSATSSCARPARAAGASASARKIETSTTKRPTRWQPASASGCGLRTGRERRRRAVRPVRPTSRKLPAAVLQSRTSTIWSLDENSPDYFGKRVPSSISTKATPTRARTARRSGCWSATPAWRRPRGRRTAVRRWRTAASTTPSARRGRLHGRSAGHPRRTRRGSLRSSSIPIATSRWSMRPNVSTDIAQEDHHALREPALPLRRDRLSQRPEQRRPRSIRAPRSPTRKYAAFYYPWIVDLRPADRRAQAVPPGGHALGIYARTDTERGVFKAPANEIVRGALDLEYRHQRSRPRTCSTRRASTPSAASRVAASGSGARAR